jgi:hypothetical protein
VGSLIVVDTDIFVDHFRGVQSASDYIRSIPGDQRATTDINVMELLKGASNIREVNLIESFLNRNGFIKLPITATASRRAVQLLKQYSLSQGLSIPDALIAGIVLESGASLVTGNIKHFQFIPELTAESPLYRRD